MKRLITVVVGTTLSLGAIACKQEATSSEPLHADANISAIVLCATCSFTRKDGSDFGATEILDQNPGNIWLYDGNAIVGKGAPELIGRMTEIGKPVTPAK